MRKLLGWIIFLGALAGVGHGFAPADAETAVAESGGQAGSVALANLPVRLSGNVSLVQGSVCQATLDEVKAKLPMDYGTRWLWADLSRVPAAGEYLPGQDVILLDAKTSCEYTGIVATHEWVHQVQDLTGTADRTMVGAYPRLEYVAECTARVIAGQHDWPHYASYPEHGGHPCTEFTKDVQDLLGLI